MEYIAKSSAGYYRRSASSFALCQSGKINSEAIRGNPRQAHLNVSPDDIIDGKYRIIKHLDAGGMGSVFEAVQVQLDRAVALKIPQFAIADDAARARFEREAMTISSLSHRNIVGFYGYGIAGTVPYIAMEYVTGTSLFSRLLNEGAIPIQDSLQICLQVLEALHCAHANGVLHRDLKPQNIMLTNSESGLLVKLIDFGFAKLLPGTGVQAQNLTAAGVVVGSVYYMSPEQCLGLEMDGRSDIYSLGCVLYQCVTGNLPFTANHTAELMQLHVEKELPIPMTTGIEEIPFPVRSIIKQAMEKNPADRFQSAEGMIASIKAALLELNSQPGGANAKRHKKLRAGAMLAILLLGSVTVAAALWGIAHTFTRRPTLQSSVEIMQQAEQLERVQKKEKETGILAKHALERNESDQLLSKRRIISAHKIIARGLIADDKLEEAFANLCAAAKLSKENGFPLEPTFYDTVGSFITKSESPSRHKLCKALVLKVLAEHPATEDLEGHIKLLKSSLAVFYASIGDVEKALAILPSDAPYASPNLNAPYIIVGVHGANPKKVIEAGECYLEQVSDPSFPREYISADALRSIIRAHVMCDRWDNGKSLKIRFSRLSHVPQAEQIPTSIRMLFQTHRHHWTEARLLAEDAFKDGLAKPARIFADQRDLDFRICAKLAAAAGQKEWSEHLLKQAKQLTDLGKAAQ
jgi:hypothetical protein